MQKKCFLSDPRPHHLHGDLVSRRPGRSGGKPEKESRALCRQKVQRKIPCKAFAEATSWHAVGTSDMVCPHVPPPEMNG